MRTILKTIICFGCICAASLGANEIVLIAGGGNVAPPCDAKAIQLKEPFYAENDPQGRLVIAEMAEGQRLLRLDSTGKVELIAGTGRKGAPKQGEEKAREASFDGIHNFAIHPKTGDIYIAETWNAVVRKFDVSKNTIVTIAGTGKKGFSGDGGAATKAGLGGIYCVALDPKSERLLLADLHNYCVRAIDLKSGMITRVAGNGKRGKPVEGGIAIKEPLVDPRAVVADRNGNIYLLERGGNALRVVTPDGKIRTVVNANGKKGDQGANGSALNCEMNGPKHIQIDQKNRVLIADAENHRILRYDPVSEKTELIAGVGKPGTEGLNGPAVKAMLNRPHGVFETPEGDLIVTDSYNNRVLKITR